MKLHEFTMHDTFNSSMETLNQYARDAAEREIPFLFADPLIHDVIIHTVEHEGLPVQNSEETCYRYVVYGEIVTKFEDRLNNLQKDCETILKHPSHHSDLLNIVLTEDVMELIKFARKVSNVFKRPLKEGSGDQYIGYVDTVNTLREEIFE